MNQKNEGTEIEELRKKIREMTETLEHRKEKQDLETQLTNLETQLQETQPKKTSEKILNGLKKDLGSLGKRLADWWTMEGLTEKQKQQKKQQFMQASNNLFNTNEQQPENIPDPLGLLNKPTQNTKHNTKNQDKQRKKTTTNEEEEPDLFFDPFN